MTACTFSRRVEKIVLFGLALSGPLLQIPASCVLRGFLTKRPRFSLERRQMYCNQENKQRSCCVCALVSARVQIYIVMLHGES
jgi:hypothetical protein